VEQKYNYEQTKVEEYSDSDDEEYIIGDEFKLIAQIQQRVRLPIRLQNEHVKYWLI
jgi:hypothetical protein